MENLIKLYNNMIMLRQGQRVVSVACGAEHSLAALDTGEVFAWGWGRYGNLGDGAKIDRCVASVTSPSSENLHRSMLIS